MGPVLLYHPDKAIQEVMQIVFQELKKPVTIARNETHAHALVSSVKFDCMFLAFWKDTETAVYTLIKEHEKRWDVKPYIVLMQQAPIPHRLFGLVEDYHVLNMPITFGTLERLLK